MHTTTLTVPKPMHGKFKTMCKEKGVPVNSYLIIMMERELENFHAKKFEERMIAEDVVEDIVAPDDEL